MTQSLAQRWMVHYRRLWVVLVHLALWSVSLFGAFLLRFEFSIPADQMRVFVLSIGGVLLLRGLCFASFGMFSGMWRYTGAKDLVALFKAATLSTALFPVFLTIGALHSFPRSILFIDWLLTMMLVGGLRFGIRTLWQVAGAAVTAPKDRKRLLIVGAGNAGEMLLRELQKTYGNRYQPVGFADDDQRKLGKSIHGVPVLGTIAQVPELVDSKNIQEIIIAIPTATGRDMRQIVDACKPSGVSIRTIPGIDQVIDGVVHVSQLRNVNIEDLLRRDAVTLDQRSLSQLLQGRVVMVTGAGGSIGSELCRQIVRFKPSQLLLVERSENALFEIHRELAGKSTGLHLVPCIADIGDAPRIQHIFSQYRPSVLLHAAAHKHVPMMEVNPGEAVKNNILGTQILADAALAHQVEVFVMISTDKAVNPTSVMGASKRIAELYVQALSQRGKTRFVAVRFGNVLGSAGSVIPIFKEQIAMGGPITVTHPEMRRYFMTIPEASQLVLQAGAMGRGGEIFVLDMGEPVKIVDLARDLISLSGLRPDIDVEIQFTGVRPGEKLFEELNAADENADHTLHPKIFVGKLSPQPYDKVRRDIEQLVQVASGAQPQQIVDAMQQLVPEFSRPEILQLPMAEVLPIRRAVS